MKRLLVLLAIATLLQIALSWVPRLQVKMKLNNFENHMGVEGLDDFRCCDKDYPPKLWEKKCPNTLCDHSFKVYGRLGTGKLVNRSDWSSPLNMMDQNNNTFYRRVGHLKNFFVHDITDEYEGQNEYEIQVHVTESDFQGRYFKGLKGENPVVNMSVKLNVTAELPFQGPCRFKEVTCTQDKDMTSSEWQGKTPTFTLQLQYCFRKDQFQLGKDNRNGKHGRGKRNLGLYDDDDDEDETDVY